MKILTVYGGPLSTAAWFPGHGLVSIMPAEQRQPIEQKLTEPKSEPTSIVHRGTATIEEGFEPLATGSIEHARRVFEDLGCDVYENEIDDAQAALLAR